MLVSWLTTNRCNLKCKHCYQDAGTNFEDELSTDEGKKLIDEITRAGFKNDMIRTARHYWNLVDLGEGWYHYDTCPRKDKPYFFMWGDNQLMEYSKANGGSHDYDHTKWPDVVP